MRLTNYPERVRRVDAYEERDEGNDDDADAPAKATTRSTCESLTAENHVQDEEAHKGNDIRDRCRSNFAFMSAVEACGLGGATYR